MLSDGPSVTVITSRLLLKYIFLAQIPGGIIEDSCVLRGVMINKDVTHPRMRRYIKNPRIVLLDSSLEYKKGESQVRSLAWLVFFFFSFSLRQVLFT